MPLCHVGYVHSSLLMPACECGMCCNVRRYGTLNRVEIKRNYAFVEFKELDDAIEAQKKCHGLQMDGRTITVEFIDTSRQRRDDRWVYMCGNVNMGLHPLQRICTAHKGGVQCQLQAALHDGPAGHIGGIVQDAEECLSHAPRSMTFTSWCPLSAC